jgi:hypothetical protein
MSTEPAATDNVCVNDGMLVGMTLWLPDDPSERFVAPPDVVGCNRLYCGSCRSWVRHLDQVHLATAEPLDTEPIFLDPAAAARRPLFRPDNFHRVYLCRCSRLLPIAGAMSAGNNDSYNESWSCAGHPPAVAVVVDPPQPATGAAARALMIQRAGRPWDFVLRWRPSFLLREVLPLVDAFARGAEPMLRERAIEFVSAFPIGDPSTVGLLTFLARDHPDWYRDPPRLRPLLANALCRKALTIRHEREELARAVANLFGDAPPIAEAATLLSAVMPEVVVARASAWTEERDDALAAKDAAVAMATLRRDQLLALLRALAGRSRESRRAIGEAVLDALTLPDDQLRRRLADAGLPAPTTMPTADEVRAALELT